MKKTLFIFLLGISVLAQANTQTIGVGAYYKNSVYHSKNQVNALPIINLEYNRFYLKGYKPGFTFYKESDLMWGLALDFKIDKNIDGHSEVIFGNHGTKVNIKLNRAYKVNDRVTFIPAVTFNYYNSKYMDYYIGIKEKDIQNNSKIEKTYKGKDTIAGGVSATLDMAMTEQTSFLIFGGIDIYDKKIKRSDIVKTNNQYYVGAGLRYSF